MSQFPPTETVQGVDLRKMMGLITIEQFAHALRVTEDTLASWRKDKVGPAYVKLGRGIFYRQSDILAWVEQSVVPTNDQATTSSTPIPTHEVA
jgi:predicted DNA-binding transcriptional regulator AlpA